MIFNLTINITSIRIDIDTIYINSTISKLNSISSNSNNTFYVDRLINAKNDYILPLNT